MTQNFISKKYVNSYIFHLFASKVNDGLLYNCMCIINDYTEYRKDVLTHLTRSLVTVGIYDAFVFVDKLVYFRKWKDVFCKRRNVKQV